MVGLRRNYENTEIRNDGIPHQLYFFFLMLVVMFNHFSGNVHLYVL